MSELVNKNVQEEEVLGETKVRLGEIQQHKNQRLITWDVHINKEELGDFATSVLSAYKKRPERKATQLINENNVNLESVKMCISVIQIFRNCNNLQNSKIEKLLVLINSMVNKEEKI